MTKKLVVVIGSGASFDSGYKVRLPNADTAINPPTDMGFFKDIREELIKDHYDALWRFKSLYYPFNAKVRMEDLWTAVSLNHKHIRLGTYKWFSETDAYIRARNSFYPQMDFISPITHYPYSGGGYIEEPMYNEFKFLGDCDRDFRRLLYDVYSSYIPPDAIKDNFRLLNDKLSSARNCKLIAYISFNYDCYLENALNPHFKYVSSNDNAEDIDSLLHGNICLIKLHGSLNWEETVTPRLITYQSPPFDRDKQVKPYYPDDLHWSQPAIIPPTIFKQEINDDSRTGDFLTLAILQQWRAAIRILTEADKIIFIGYSFPNADYHSRRIFQIATMRRRSEHKHPFELLYCGGDEERREVLLEVFGAERDIKTTKFFSNLPNSKELAEYLDW